MRTLCALYPNEVMGIVLVDSSHEDQRERIDALPWHKPSSKERITNFFERDFKLQLICFTENLFWPKPELFSNGEWQYHLSLMSRYKHFSSMQKARKFIKISKKELKKMNGNVGEKPLIVITLGKSDDISKENNVLFQLKIAQEKIWFELQKELLELSSTSQHIIAHQKSNQRNDSSIQIPH